VDWCAINVSKTASLDSVVQQDLGDVCGMINLCRTGALPSIYANTLKMAQRLTAVTAFRESARDARWYAGPNVCFCVAIE
jgi:hypothetical protein